MSPTIEQLKDQQAFEEAIDAHNREMKEKGEPYEVPKTLYDHPCTVLRCGKTIPAGSRAWAITQKKDGKFETYYKHLPKCPEDGEEVETKGQVDLFEK